MNSFEWAVIILLAMIWVQGNGFVQGWFAQVEGLIRRSIDWVVRRVKG